MHTIIEDIISRIPVGLAFDAHLVIAKINREHRNDYDTFVEPHSAINNKHSQLAKIIASFEDSLIERMDNRSLSYNIHDNATPCTLWRCIAQPILAKNKKGG